MITMPEPIAKALQVEKWDDKERTFVGIASAEIIDKVGEVIPIDEMEKTMEIWMQRGAPITDSHSNRVVGKGLGWERTEIQGKPAIRIKGKIHDDYATDDMVWGKIKSGAYKGLSFGGANHSRGTTVIDGKMATELTNIEQHEMAVVASPCNPASVIEDVNFTAKSDPLTKEELDKIDKAVSKETNPWAVCHAQGLTGDKFERCVQHIKEKIGYTEKEGAEKSTYQVIDLPTGDRLAEVTFPDGSKQVIPLPKIEKTEIHEETFIRNNIQNENRTSKEARQEDNKFMENHQVDKAVEVMKPPMAYGAPPQAPAPTAQASPAGGLEAELAQIKSLLQALMAHQSAGEPSEPETKEAKKDIAPSGGRSPELKAGKPVDGGETLEIPENESEPHTVPGHEKEGDKSDAKVENYQKKVYQDQLKKGLGIGESNTPRPKGAVNSMPQIIVKDASFYARNPKEIMTDIRKSGKSNIELAKEWNWRKVGEIMKESYKTQGGF